VHVCAFWIWANCRLAMIEMLFGERPVEASQAPAGVVSGCRSTTGVAHRGRAIPGSEVNGLAVRQAR